MGEVYKAKDLKLDRHVVIKVLRPELADDSERLRRFEQEARAASALNHPNIVTVHDLGEQQGAPYIVMEYVAGVTLREMLAGGPLPHDKVVRYVAQLAAGMAKAHQAGIVHRDLKPGNIIISEDGFLKIVDFGLAKLSAPWTVDSEASTIANVATTPGTILGTVGYMAPEQAKGQSGDFRSDQFSFGAIVYEMETGKRAFGRETPAETLAAILNDDIDLDAEAMTFAGIVARCLNKDPDERWPRTQDLVDALSVSESSVAPKEPSVAVLPFSNTSADPEQEYFCDGMAEEIINALSRVRGLRVVARTSAFAFKGKQHDVREIGKILNVETLLEGSVRKSGDRIRITTQLVNIADGYQLWSERYDRKLTNVFDIQDEISLAVVSQLKVELLGQEKASTTKRTMSDVDAYNLCLLGRHHWYKFTEDGMKAARGHFEEALELAPDSARAHAGLADVYLAGGGVGLSLFRGIDVLPKAKFHAEKAIALDPGLGQAYGTLGLLRTWFEWDWAAAEQVMNRGVEIEPSSAGGYICRSYYLTIVGRHEEAIGDIQRGIELDPVSSILFSIAGWHHYYVGRLDEALEYYERAIELVPDFYHAQIAAGLVLLQNGKLDEVISRFEIGRSQWPRFFESLLGYAYAQAGQRPAAMQVLGDYALYKYNGV